MLNITSNNFAVTQTKHINNNKRTQSIQKINNNALSKDIFVKSSDNFSKVSFGSKENQIDVSKGIKNHQLKILAKLLETDLHIAVQDAQEGWENITDNSEDFEFATDTGLDYTSKDNCDIKDDFDYDSKKISKNTHSYMLHLDDMLKGVKDKKINTYVSNILDGLIEYFDTNTDIAEEDRDELYQTISTVENALQFYNTIKNPNYIQLNNYILDSGLGISVIPSPISLFCCQYPYTDIDYSLKSKYYTSPGTSMKIKELYNGGIYTNQFFANSQDNLTNYIYDNYYIDSLHISDENKEKIEKLNKEFGIKVFPSSIYDISISNKSTTKLGKIFETMFPSAELIAQDNDTIEALFNEINAWSNLNTKAAKLPQKFIINKILTPMESQELYLSKNNFSTQVILNTNSTRSDIRREIIRATNNSKSFIDQKKINNTLANDMVDFLYFLIESKKNNSTEQTDFDIFKNIISEWNTNGFKSKYAQELLTAGVSPKLLETAHQNNIDFIAIAGSAPNTSAYSAKFKKELIEMGLPKFVFDLPPIEE